MVRPREIPPIVPANPGRSGEGRAAGKALRRPRLLAEAAGLKQALIDDAKAAGFDVVRVTAPDAIPEAASRLADFVGLRRHGEMDWIARTAERRGSPAALWPEARSVVMLGLNYGPDADPLAALAEHDRGAISVYARNRDYHDLIKGRLKQVASRFAARTGHEVKVFVDTAPLMEKPLAEAAGIGWQGKHTNLVSRDFGSWLFLGAILTAAELEADEAAADHCGSCRACLDACPTDAFPAPYQLDARRCISYLTIEHKGPIPHAYREAIGNRVYGCDDCLAVCPWNRFAKAGHEAKLAARDDLRRPALAELVVLDDAGFRDRFAGSPIKRIGRDRFIRNVLIAIGNSADRNLAKEAERLLADPSPLVRGAAVWAVRRLLALDEIDELRLAHLAAERDGSVRSEWNRAA